MSVSGPNTIVEGWHFFSHNWSERFLINVIELLIKPSLVSELSPKLNKQGILKYMALIGGQMLMREFEILIWSCLNSKDIILKEKILET